MKSFAQDLVFGVTRGMIKPPKQILLSYTVKTLTNNVELLSILNRYGHGVSYSQLEDAGERQRPKPSLRSKRFHIELLRETFPTPFPVIHVFLLLSQLSRRTSRGNACYAGYPKPRTYVEVNCQEALENTRRKNLLWVLVRLLSSLSCSQIG